MSSTQAESPGYTVSPLPEQAQAFLQQFFSAQRVSILYEGGHPIATTSRERACQALAKWLEEHDRLSLAASADGLLVDGEFHQQTPEMVAFARRVRSRGIQAITFQPPADPSEMLALLELIGQDRDRIWEAGGPRQALAGKGVTTIQLSELADHVYQGKPSKPGSRQRPRLVSHLNKTGLVDFLIGEAPDLQEEDNYRLLQAVQSPQGVSDLIQACLSQVPNQTETDSSRLASTLLDNIEAGLLSQGPELWEKHKWAIRQAISLLPPSIRPKTFALDFPRRPSVEEQPAEKPSSRQLSADPRVTDLLSEMSQAMSEAVALPASMQSSPVQNTSRADVRRVRPIGSLIKTLTSIRLEEPPTEVELKEMLPSITDGADREVVGVFCEMLEGERKLESYSVLASRLEEEACRLLDRKEYDIALQVAAVFAKHAGPGSSRPIPQRERARNALQNLGIPVLTELTIQAYRRADPHLTKLAESLVPLLGPKAVPALLELVSASLPGGSAPVLSALAQMGPEAVPELARAFSRGYGPVALAAAQVLAEMHTSEAIVALEQGMNSPDPLLRLAVTQHLGQQAGPRSGDLLLTALRDKDSTVRRAAAGALGQLKLARAVPQLSNIAERCSPLSLSRLMPERMAAIVALGQIGTLEAVTSLERMLKRRCWFGAKINNQAKEAAAAALGQTGLPEAHGILERQASGRSPVAEAARRALENIRRQSAETALSGLAGSEA